MRGSASASCTAQREVRIENNVHEFRHHPDIVGNKTKQNTYLFSLHRVCISWIQFWGKAASGRL